MVFLFSLKLWKNRILYTCIKNVDNIVSTVYIENKDIINKYLFFCYRLFHMNTRSCFLNVKYLHEIINY